MVFQNYALWPHMTVFENVSFGLRLRKLPRARSTRARRAACSSWSGCTHQSSSYPAQLSGGQQQRVALARALVLEPHVLLLDEPLSNLDAKLRVRVREDIREIQQRIGITTVFVTHDQDEALSISDRIAVMSGGKVEQYADPAHLYREPATHFVASFVGAMNVYTRHRRRQRGRARRRGARPLRRPLGAQGEGDRCPARGRAGLGERRRRRATSCARSSGATTKSSCCSSATRRRARSSRQICRGRAPPRAFRASRSLPRGHLAGIAVACRGSMTPLTPLART